MKKVDTKICRLLTMRRSYHPNFDVNTFYHPRKKGGTGIVQHELSIKTSVLGVDTYLNNKNGWMLNLVKKDEEKHRMYSITNDAGKKLNKINLSTDNISENSTSTEKPKQTKTNSKTINKVKEGWEDKPLHSKYPIRVRDLDVNSSLIYQWLASLGLKSETKGFIIVAQDQSLPMKNFQANILKNGAEPENRVCDKHTMTIDHLVFGCPILVPTKYLKQHDRLCQYIH